jgi:hypothetical protein
MGPFPAICLTMLPFASCLSASLTFVILLPTDLTNSKLNEENHIAIQVHVPQNKWNINNRKFGLYSVITE